LSRTKGLLVNVVARFASVNQPNIWRVLKPGGVLMWSEARASDRLEKT
jgi:predicted methyltransferase